MSFFTGSAHLVHSSKLPAGATKESGIAMLSDHEFFLHCDPHLSKFEALTPDAAPEIPENIRDKMRGDESKRESYSVTDIVHTIPAGLWDSNVVSTYEFTDISDGVFVRIRSPLSIVMDTVWEIKEAEDGLELVEDITITCSRLLLPVVRSQCEGGWAKIHAKMLSRLEETKA
ncbi:hypothetical protein QBC47DRAFT_381962 [Echria macrotheca]|uniref:DUF7053 domain-containing protein n=1 Tax=Echria macrotheca TaxID=438768 RepID=A0AAJ0F5S8_9PEZI|nr:hypothetical protein QBC47DRAFT_381962 [Echria macrotheca]